MSLNKRKRNHLSLFLLSIGAVLILIALIVFQKNDDDSMQMQTERSIVAHNSATLMPSEIQEQEKIIEKNSVIEKSDKSIYVQNNVNEIAQNDIKRSFRGGKYFIIHSEPFFPLGTPESTKLASQTLPYIVAPGDILGRIAQKHHCSIEEILRANNLPNDQIKIGQKLYIPPCADKAAKKLAEPENFKPNP